MHETRLAEWLKSIEGITTALSTAAAAFVAVYAAVESKLAPAAELIGLQNGAAQAAAQSGALLLLLPLLWLVVRSYSRFAKASRLEQPDLFTLTASTPESLIGRTEDLARLQDCVAKNRVVLLDGESGCGKSALVAAGLVPRLLASNGLLPVLIRDWGDDWVRGPLATALGALFDVLTPEQRGTLGWTQAPDLAADASALAAELGQRFDGVAAQLGRRPLLIADQFDDYQARHRAGFVDFDGNWLKPDALAADNPFWALTRARLQAGALHLLTVTRADAASGLSCVRFLDATMTADRHLPRVDLEYLRPLLERLAPADAVPAVVSQPEDGWYELRSRLEADLRLQGAVLMQQVRTVLLGLRQLPMLNVCAYRRAGGLRGTESLVIARAIRRAGDAAGGGEAKRTLARRLLGALVHPGGASQSAKAERASLAVLAQLVGHDATATVMLQMLQADDVVRPAGGLDRGTAWQLDHDYLAHAVVAEARQADRWGVTLREGLERFHQAGNAWRRRWTTLLPSEVQARLVWERINGRLRYGEAAGYARLSLLKPALAALVLGTASAGAYLWNEDRLLSVAAASIYDRFGSLNEAAAVFDTWRAPRAVRSRLYRLVQEDENRLERATRSAWPHAHGGVETGSLQQSARVLGERLAREKESRTVARLAQHYAAVAAKLTDQSSIQQAAATLRERLAHETDYSVSGELINAYAPVAAKLTDPSTIQQEAVALRECLARVTDVGTGIASRLVHAYSVVALKLANPSAIQQETAALRERMANETNYSLAANLINAYAVVAATLTDPPAIQREAAALGELLASKTDSRIAWRFALAYSEVAAKSNDSPTIQQAAVALRERLARATDAVIAEDLVDAYAKVAAKLTDPSAIEWEAVALRGLLAHETDFRIARSLADAYAKVASKLADPSAIQQAAAALRGLLTRETDSRFASPFAHAYATVVTMDTDPFTIQQAAAALRKRLTRATSVASAGNLAKAYALVAAKLTEPSAIQQDAAALRERLARETDSSIAAVLAKAYSEVVTKLTDLSTIEQATALLREGLARESDNTLSLDFDIAYAKVAAKLTDPSAIRQEAAALRERLARETHYPTARRFANAYAEVTDKLTDRSVIAQEAAVLRGLLARDTESPKTAAILAYAYASVAAKLTDPSAIEQAAAALRGRLARETDFDSAKFLVGAYAQVAAKLTDQSAIEQAAIALRERLARATDSEAATFLAGAYAMVVTKLSDVSAIEREAAALRERLARETDSNIVLNLAECYAAVVALVLIQDPLRRADWATAEVQMRQILVMAGHPFLRDARSLLAVLEPFSGYSFGSDVTAAVEWWGRAYKGDPATLRPPPSGPP